MAEERKAIRFEGIFDVFKILSGLSDIVSDIVRRIREGASDYPLCAEVEILGFRWELCVHRSPEPKEE